MSVPRSDLGLVRGLHLKFISRRIYNMTNALTIFTFLLLITPSWVYCFKYEHFSEGYFSSIHVITVNPQEEAILPVRAQGKKVKRETVAALAKQYGARAAINGGFWTQNGTPAGILKINGQWYATPNKPRGAIGWSDHGKKVIIDRVMTNYSLRDSPSPSAIAVIPVSQPPYTTAEQWAKIDNIVGGSPVLIKNGVRINDFESEKVLDSFIKKRHPRTAVGVKKNGDWVFVVVDGRFFFLFGGMTIQKLADFMLNLGCVEALNLDGGGSSTMFIDGAVINSPSGTTKENGKKVTAVSDAILVF